LSSTISSRRPAGALGRLSSSGGCRRFAERIFVRPLCRPASQPVSDAIKSNSDGLAWMTVSRQSRRLGGHGRGPTITFYPGCTRSCSSLRSLSSRSPRSLQVSRLSARERLPAGIPLPELHGAAARSPAPPAAARTGPFLPPLCLSGTRRLAHAAAQGSGLHLASREPPLLRFLLRGSTCESSSSR
jgi:hypothetical protein